jgi:hypothetical protein
MANSKMRLTLCTLGLFTIAAVIAPSSHSAAQGLSATTIDMSAQALGEKKGKPQGQQSKQQNIQVKQPRTVQQKQQKNIQIKQPKTVQQKQPKNIQTKQPKTVQPKQPKNIQIKQPKNVQQQQKTLPQQKTNQKLVGQKAPKVRNAARASFGGRNFSVWRQNHRVRYGGGWRTFVALGILAPLLIGANEFYPYAYLEAPEDYCEGLTEDGCELVWDNVETIEGDVIPQCVAYCPWQ